jgi:hypothetical protein
MPDPVTGLRNDSAWLGFVSRSSPQGQAWAADYGRPEHLEIKLLADEALGLLRRGRIIAGKARLDFARGRLQELAGAPQSVLCVLASWYHSAAAYYHYLRGDFDAAEQCLATAYDAARRGMDLERCLVPLAYVCSEFAFQRIRIARNRRRWDEMARQVAVVRGMLEDRTPLCTVGDGTPIFSATLREFCLGADGLDGEDRALVERMFSPEAQLVAFDRFVERAYALSGFVIPYR